MGVTTSGSFDNTEKFLRDMSKNDIKGILGKFGQQGVDALSLATPKRSGHTARSWKYRVDRKGKRWVVEWYNTNFNGDSQIAVLIQYGHGTGTGGFIEGIDYINPAMQPIFDQVIAEIWKGVKG